MAAQKQQAKADSNERTFKKVGATESNIRFIRPKQLMEENAIGLIVQGVYQGTVPNTFDDSKLDHKILSDDGTMFVLNSGGNLGYRLKDVEPGTAVRVSYEGMTKITKGKWAGKSSHSYSIEVEA